MVGWSLMRREASTDLWVARQLDSCDIAYTPQGSAVKDINTALAAASKRGTGRAGYPEYVAVVDDYVLVIEDKASLDRHVHYDETGVVSQDVKPVTDYAVNGAVFYAKHIAQHSPFHKVFAIGVSGDERHHRITPVYVDDREGYKILDDVESFISFTPSNIREYYERQVLNQQTDVEKTTAEILRDAAELHEYLRTYGSLKDQDKPLVVAGILLALDELEHGFSLDTLKGESYPGGRDGDFIYDAIRRRLNRSNVGPDTKRDTMLSEFSIITSSAKLNEPNTTLGMTPLRYYTQFLYERLFTAIKYQQSSEDFIGRFYGEFMSYSGGDGQTLGIILTPRHITDLMCDLLGIHVDDVVLDPTCGTGGFLISAMHRMVSQADGKTAVEARIKKQQLHGYELQPNMFVIAAANMILRRDGNANLRQEDFLKQPTGEVQLKRATVGLMNPPYSQGSKTDPSQYELSFVEHLLDCLAPDARCAVIVPQSSMTGKTKAEQAFKTSILNHHTLEGVITCNTNTFYGVGTNPVIAVFTAHMPHDPEHGAKFIDFRDDGYEVRPHVGLVEGDSAKDKRQHLLDVWNDRIEAPSKMCVRSAVTAGDDWLHSFYYFNDEIPTDADFEKSIGDYLTFEFSMVMQNREYLFKGDDEDAESK